MRKERWNWVTIASKETRICEPINQWIGKWKRTSSFEIIVINYSIIRESNQRIVKNCPIQVFTYNDAKIKSCRVIHVKNFKYVKRACLKSTGCFISFIFQTRTNKRSYQVSKVKIYSFHSWDFSFFCTIDRSINAYIKTHDVLVLRLKERDTIIFLKVTWHYRSL